MKAAWGGSIWTQSKGGRLHTSLLLGDQSKLPSFEVLLLPSCSAQPPSPNCPHPGTPARPGLPLFLDAIFSASRGVLKSRGSLAGLWPWMEMACTCTMYSVSSSRSQSAHDRVVVFTSWMKRSIRTSFFWKGEGLVCQCASTNPTLPTSAVTSPFHVHHHHPALGCHYRHGTAKKTGSERSGCCPGPHSD